MRFSFSLRGHSGSFDMRAILRSDEGLAAVQRRMIDELGIEAGRAERILTDMLGRALLRHGDHLVAARSALVDRVIGLRNQLDALYSTALNFNAQSGRGARVDSGTASLDDQLRQIDGMYRELDDALTDLGKPFDEVAPPPGVANDVPAVLGDEIGRSTPSTRTQPERPVTHDTTPQGASGRVRIETGRYRFAREVTADGRTVYRRSFEDGASVTFEIQNGQYRLETFDAAGNRTSSFGEYDILHSPYGRRPRTTAIMQAHHGMQNSLMTQLFGNFGYNGNAAPTIWLRNSRSGSPHGSITAVQNGQRSTRNAAGTTYSDIRRWALDDLLMTDMPRHKIEEYLAGFDHFFETTVLPNIPEAQRPALLGDWTPRLGLEP
jgi:hypothetical protein